MWSSDGPDVVVKGSLMRGKERSGKPRQTLREAAGVRFGKIYACCADHKRSDTLHQTRAGVSMSFSSLV
jgi:hypothetical protein